jgi:hypothetical protein
VEWWRQVWSAVFQRRSPARCSVGGLVRLLGLSGSREWMKVRRGGVMVATITDEAIASADNDATWSSSNRRLRKRKGL